MQEPSPSNFEMAAWRDLRTLVKRIKYGQIKVQVQDGMPVRVEEALRSVKLGIGEVA